MAVQTLSRRQFTLLGIAAAVPWPARAQGRTGLAPGIGVWADFVNGAYRMTGAGVARNVVFAEWELPGKVLSTTTIFQNRRILYLTKFNEDGTIEANADTSYTRGRISGTGSYLAESIGIGSFAGRRSTYEFRRVADGRYAIVGELDGRAFGWRIDRISEEEANQAAARLYPAEYGRTTTATAVQPPLPSGSSDDSSLARTAFVVGVSNYQHLPDLPNPVNDARAIADRFSAIGYRVELLLNPDRATFFSTLEQFHSASPRLDISLPALFYYAGHAIEVGGRNYLLPTDLEPEGGSGIETQAISVDSVIEILTVGQQRTRIVILDACRTSPLRRRDVGRGLAQISAPEGTFIAFSTAPGMVAADGAGRNSPFATALLNELGRPRQPVEVIFRNVRRSVLRSTEGEQLPWDSSSLLEATSLQ